MSKRLRTSILSTLLFFIFPRIAFASEQFETSFNSTYTISPTGQAQVTQQISLKNRFSDIYATEYALEISSSNLSDITVTNSANTSIPFTISTNTNSTAIQLIFDQKVVGKGKVQQFTISYTNPDVSFISGQVLEISIPKISNSQSVEHLSINLVVPKEFNLPTFTNPSTYSLFDTVTHNTLTFTHPSLKTQGASALFGSTQSFNFTLNYHLDNPTNSIGISQIALPPDTPYQQLFYYLIDPAPLDIKTDPDGNWLATYHLKPKSRLDVIAQGQVQIHLQPQSTFPTYSPPSSYLSSNSHWPTDNPTIKQLVRELTTPEDIYTFIVDTFTYDYSLLNSLPDSRQGALKALENPASALCQDFTDTFITLSRAAGIPARELNGYAHTKNDKLRPLSLLQDVLHSWPEYYDYQTSSWIQVDPTWGNTTGGIDYFNTFDLNHFTFVIHGHDSTQPFPAGYYKFQDSVDKDILIDFASSPQDVPSQIQVQLELSPLSFTTLTAPATLFVSNLGPSALYQYPLSLSTSGTSQVSPSQITLPTLLPFTTITSRLKLSVPSPFSSSHNQLHITTPHQQLTHEIDPIKNQSDWVIPTFTLSLGTILIAIAYFSWNLLVSRFRRQHSLRR